VKRTFTVFFSAFGLLMSALPCGGQQVAQQSSEIMEVKVDVAETDISIALANLQLKTDAATVREIYFFDTQQLDLFHRNIILRARKDEKKGDFVVKVRPIDSSTIDPHWFSEPGFKCSIDVTTSDSKEQCVVKEKVAAEDIDNVADGAQTIADLLTKRQRTFAQSYGFTDDLIANTATIGPMTSSEWDISADNDDDMSAELWVLPQGQRFLELSTKVELGEDVKALAHLRQLLKKLNIREREIGENKTEFVMELFLKNYPSPKP